MTVLERANQLRVAVGEVRQAKKLEKIADALEDKRKTLVPARQAFEATVDSAALLVRKQCLGASDLPSCRQLEESVAKVLEAFAESPSSISEGRRFTTLTGRLEKLTTEIGYATGTAWKRFTADDPRANAALLSRIAQIRGQGAAVNALRTSIGELREVSRKPPGDEGEWSDYQNALTAVKSRLERIRPDQFPESVLEFCKAAQSDGADPGTLTEEVRDWLEEHGMLKDLRYRFK